MDYVQLLISIFLFIYTATGTFLTFSQVGYANYTTNWTNGDKALSFITNIVLIFVFIILYTNGLLITQHVEFLKFFISYIILLHIAKAIYSCRNYANNIRSWSMSEIYFNMIVYTSVVYGMLILWVF